MAGGRPVVLAEMGSSDSVVEVDFLERRLLPGSSSKDGVDAEDEVVLYNASFEEMEENYVKYQTTLWILYSLLLILAWGIGLLMLLYIPVRRHVLRKDFRSRRLCLTPNAIVYKVMRPVPFPCFGVLKKEKHVLLLSVADVVIEQGYLQSLFGIYSIRIENAGVRRPANDDVHIQGIANPRTFRKVVLTRLASMRGKRFSGQVSTSEDVLGSSCHNASFGWTSLSKSMKNDYLPHGERILQKLEEIGSYVKKVQSLMENRSSQTSESLV